MVLIDTELSQGSAKGSPPAGYLPAGKGERRGAQGVLPVRHTVNRERSLNHRPGAAAPRHLAPAACLVRPAARPLRFLVLLGLSTAITVVLLSLLASVNGAAEVPTSTTVTQVHGGESLWGVARRVAPGSDTAEVVARIRELNSMSSGVPHPGQPLVVPARPVIVRDPSVAGTRQHP